MGKVRSVSEDIQDPEIRQILAELDARGGSAPFGIEQKREAYRANVVRAGQVELVAAVEDRTVPGPGGNIPVRIYHPPVKAPVEGTRSSPAILYLHGGGFFSGDLDTHDPVCRSLANRVPAVVVAVDYRRSPEHPYPAATDDCFAVLRWLQSGAAELGVGPAHLFVVGDSAGGNLAAVMPLMARDAGGPQIAAQVLIYPMADATFAFPSQVENALIPPFTLVDCVYVWQLYLAGTAASMDRRHPYISPVFGKDLAGLPPALIITAEFDILADEGQAYASKLREAGVIVQHHHFPDMVHGFFQWGGIVGDARLAIDQVVQYVQAQPFGRSHGCVTS